MPSRRTFLSALLASAAAPGLRDFANTAGSIDRESLVCRHNPINTGIDPLSALSLGNGSFAFTADVTGLQTLEQEYERTMPLYDGGMGMAHHTETATSSQRAIASLERRAKHECTRFS
jgi:hypothetical protein